MPPAARARLTAESAPLLLDDGEEDSYGRHITLCGDDGREYRYLHLNNDTPGTDDGAAGLEHVFAPGIRQGLRVARGQHIAYMGDSGNAEATAPHLHLDVFDDAVLDPYGDNRINPYPSLMAALALDITVVQFLERLRSAVTTDTFFVGLVKAPVFAFIIAMVGCFEGLQVTSSAESVGTRTTRSVVEAIFLVIVLDALFSIFFSFIGV